MALSSKARTITLIILAVALVGFIDASYLTASHYLNRDLPCILTKGCDVVTKSQYAEIADIPVAVFGMLNYLILFVAVLRYREAGSSKALRVALLFSSAAFLFSLWLIYVQAFLLSAYCFYCMVSASSATVIFILILTLWRYRRIPN